jgi:transglutaminase-like putative cysteine protease
VSTFAAPLRGDKKIEDEIEATPAKIKLSSFVHAALLAIALAVFAWPISLPVGIIWGALAAGYGAWIAERLIDRRYRLPAVLALALLVVLLGRLMLYVFVEATWMSELISPVGSLNVAEALRWGTVAFGVSVALRAIALRYRAALAIEGGVVVAAVATTVAAHRGGMIARPLEVSDWFWTQGIDPVVAFLAIGLAGALLFAGVLAYGRSPKRTIAQLLFVLVLGGMLAMRIHGADVERPDQQPPGASKDDDQKGGAGKGGKEEKDQQASAGFKQDDMPRPGGGSQQNRPAAVVVFHKDVQPSSGVFYFRHASFSQFNGTRLIETSRGDVDQDVVRSFPVVRTEVLGPSREAEGRELVATDVALMSEHRRPFVLTDAVEAAPLPNPEPARFRRAYSVVSSVITETYDNLIGTPAGDPSWSDDVWEYYTEMPKDERYHKLAATLKSQLRKDYQNDPIALAMTTKRYLEQSATYSFSKNYDGEEDPTAAFLFSEEMKGYCVHLAHSAAYLLRANGVPARVSAGYGVPSENLGGGSSLLIKQGDAHAWAEIYLEDIGWVPVEVTPEKTDVKPQTFAERDLQQLLGEMARKEGREGPKPYSGPKLGEIIRQAMALVPYLLGALLALAYLMKWWRLLGPYFAGAKRQPIVAYRAALDRLSAAGYLREHGEPRERFAKRVKEFSPSFLALTNKHVAVAYGSRDALRSVASAEGHSLRSLASSVGGEVRKKVPLWRWLIGVLNPVSWLWSR